MTASGRKDKAKPAKKAGRREADAGKPKSQPLPDLFSVKFLDFAETSPYMVFVVYSGRVIYVNAEFEKTMGYTKADASSSGFDLRSTVLPEFQHVFDVRFGAGAVEHDGEPVELRFAIRTGKKISARVLSKRVGLSEGSGTVGIMLEITDLRQLEDRLKADRDKIRMYFNSMPLLVVALNKLGKVVNVNRRTTAVLKRREDEVLGRDWFTAFRPECEGADEAEWFRQVLASGKAEAWRESRICAADNETKLIRWHYSIVQQESGDGEVCIGYGLDVEQEKVLEESLRQSEARYRTFFERSPIGIYQVTPQGRILNANPALLKMLGYASSEELLAVNLDTHGYHPDTPRRALVELMEKEGEARGFETKWLKKDGSAVSVRENARAVRDHDGHTLYYEGTIEDITKQKLSQEELRYRLNFERLISSISTRFVNIEACEVDPTINQVLHEVAGFENVDCCHTYQFAADGKQILLTNGYGSITAQGVAEEKHAVSLHPWTLKRLWRGEVVQLSDASRVVQRRIVAEAEYEYMERQGVMSLLCIPFRMYRQEAGILLMASASRDVLWMPNTVSLLRVICEILSGALELKITYSALEKERDLINSLLDNIPDHIYFKDRESRFIRVNRQMVTDFGARGMDELIGKRDFDFFTEEHARQAYNDEQELMGTGQPIVSKEERETWPDGAITWGSTTKMPMRNDKGEIVGMFGITRDITNRRMMAEQRQALEARIQYTQKLESLSVLSGTIAHDFNNLLMGILGHTSLALMELTPESPAWDSVKQIENTALCAAELTNQMLTYSGKSKASLKPLNLTSLVREMAHLLEVSVSKKIKLIYHFSDAIPPIEGDSAQLRQVIMNLIINASDAMGDMVGSITVTTGHINCDPQTLAKCVIGDSTVPGNFAFVEVTDTGCGMDEATKNRIFEPFYTTKSTGRGLGLAAVVGIVRSHKGALVLESEPGKGTTFKVMLPRSERVVTEVALGKKRDITEMSGTIMVVDDDAIVRSVTARILSKIGFSGVGAESIAKAVEEAQKLKETALLVLLDVTMPDSPARESIAAINKALPGVPIVLMSGFTLETASVDLAADSFQGFLQKPFSGEVLAHKLAEVLVGK